MSQMTLARTAPKVAPRARAALRVVDATPKTQSHTGFVLLCMALVVLGLLSALLLNTARAESSFTLADLRKEQTLLHDTRVTLEAELSAKRSPETLAVEAERLGLVPSPSTAVLRLSDNTVLGVAASVDAQDSFTVVTPFVTKADPEVKRIERSIEGAVQGG
ncbi:hypothetical protein FNH13_08065 [Ornithinimicrobium ciconiae]|uniref:Cell division protein FtsL n=1 Tax=Ornithinimicrobium ciconiae TaxID=2594265 RepID=A0A516G9V8_9MICO|nr:hypothetical protein [Ornithinimicrobium ciconiae]QDO88303.1 hypothetical protein FNH13_08065 [Ornithinimicrobium ciconiae]